MVMAKLETVIKSSSTPPTESNGGNTPSAMNQNMYDLIEYIDVLRTTAQNDLSYRDVFFKNLKSYIA